MACEEHTPNPANARSLSARAEGARSRAVADSTAVVYPSKLRPAHDRRWRTGEHAMRTGILASSATALAVTLLGAVPSRAQGKVAKDETQQIAEEAFIYGFPMVMNYTVFYEYFVDKSSPEYKTPVNQLYNTARVYTPKD